MEKREQLKTDYNRAIKELDKRAIAKVRFAKKRLKDQDPPIEYPEPIEPQGADKKNYFKFIVFGVIALLSFLIALYLLFKFGFLDFPQLF